MEIFEWDENIPVTADNLNEMQNKMIENIESANESNDNYLKLIDGTLICWGKTDVFNISAGTSITKDITLPQSFINSNYTVICSMANGGEYWANGLAFRGNSYSTSTLRILVGNYIGGATAQNIQASYIAIGRWK